MWSLPLTRFFTCKVFTVFFNLIEESTSVSNLGLFNFVSSEQFTFVPLICHIKNLEIYICEEVSFNIIPFSPSFELL